jgi:phospholipid/cholesterol/gamma-HCH transport system ATP-binding protein
VVLRDVRIGFGERSVFGYPLSCAFPRERISVILGGSGLGKSTLLRAIAGLVQPTEGTVEVAGRDITSLSERQLYSVREKIGMLFQGGALLDSLPVFDNVAFPLREHRNLPEGEVAAAVRARLQDVGLEGVEDLLPTQLSGGMLRRAALARAIMMEPEILLCDEPLSGLDPVSARRIEALLSDLNRRRRMTVLIVSHHIRSTLRVAAHVLLLLPGRSVAGTPHELASSSDPEVAEFFGEALATPSADSSPSRSTGPEDESEGRRARSGS